MFDGPLSEHYQVRARDYVELVNIYPELEDARTVLDFGGDGTIPARSFPWASISVDDLNAGVAGENVEKFDLIFASNVFEHLSDPVPVLRDLTARLNREGFLFIDVPAPNQSSLTEGLMWQEQHGGELFEMHEHITHFSRRSLALLIRAAGLVPLFEYQARYSALSVLAVFEDSDIAKRLMPEKLARQTYFEARTARAEARAALGDIWKASSSNATRVAEMIDAKGRELTQKIESAAMDKNLARDAEQARRELDLVYRSTSWGITAPMRAISRAFRHLGKAR
jgi:SAM-dependent methyltransferase